MQEHRKNTKKGEFLGALKDYEPYLANPVVARALSEYRKVLNALIREYGKAHKIHLEFTREAKLSAKDRQKYENEQKEYLKANQNAKKQCENLGLPLNGTNILKIKLWIEQGEFCVYSGKKITKKDLEDPSVLEIDHIYPYSRSFDDSAMNKVLVFAKENQNKLNKTPFEAFGDNKEKWESILSLCVKLPKQKQRRISNKNFKDKEAGFIARNLNDTGYIARLASQWTKNCLEFLPLSDNEVTVAGEKGRNVLIQKSYGAPAITKDGVSVAKEIELADPIANMGAQLVKEVASKTADAAGDGTTTATVLAYSIYKEGLRNITAGANPIEVKRGMDKAVTAIVEELKKASKKVGGKSDIAQVATISANSDENIGALIAEAMEKVGKDGVITVEEAKGINDELSVVEGMQFDRGYLSAYFVTNTDKMTAQLENAYVLLTDKKISNMKEILPLLEATMQSGKPLLIIAEDIEGEAYDFGSE